MTAGERKINATGRSTGQIKTHRKNKIVGQFSARTIEMLRSPAYRTLSLSARRVLDRVEIEHADHGGLENGRLPVLFDDFQSYGIDRHSIAPAIRECVALGFLEITEIGRAGNAEYRRPNKFRLTYIHAPAGLTPQTRHSQWGKPPLRSWWRNPHYFLYLQWNVRHGSVSASSLTASPRARP